MKPIDVAIHPSIFVHMHHNHVNRYIKISSISHFDGLIFNRYIAIIHTGLGKTYYPKMLTLDDIFTSWIMSTSIEAV